MAMLALGSHSLARQAPLRPSFRDVPRVAGVARRRMRVRGRRATWLHSENDSVPAESIFLETGKRMRVVTHVTANLWLYVRRRA